MTNYSYNIALNMYRNLTGDYDTVFDTVESIYAAIDKEFDSGDGSFTISDLDISIIENGQYVYDKTLDIDAYIPISIDVNVPQKYTDEQVIELQTSAYNEGKTDGESIGYENGYIAGNTDGYTDGYTDGLDDGMEEQKALLENITITENGVYEKEDGYNKVVVDIEMPDIVQPVLSPLSIELTDNGEYNYTPTDDGFSSVTVSVNVTNASGDVGSGGVDFTSIGYSAADNKRINDKITANLEYTKPLVNKVNGKTNLSSAFINDTQLVYAPMGDTSNVTTMQFMFKGCSALTEIPLYDTSNVTNMNSIFYNCYSLTEIPLLDTSKVTDMSSMFYNCYNLMSIPNFNTVKVTDMDYMFNGCNKLLEIPQLDTSNVTDMSYMFGSCSELTEIPQLDTSNVTSMYYMFNSCNKLLKIPQLDTSNVTNMQSIFYNCSALTTLPEMDCSSVTNCNYIFGFANPKYLTECGGFKNLGMQSTLTNTLNSYFINNTPLTHESLLNILNGLYDRASAGYSVITLYFGTSNLSKLSDVEKAIATNKGWALK